jgi:hypothetical protein
VPWLDDLLSKTDTYRDAALIVLAFAVDSGSAAEIANPPDGRRSVAQRLAALLDELNIRARRDAFQTLAKGSNSLLGRNRESWKRLLEWAQVCAGRGIHHPAGRSGYYRYLSSRAPVLAKLPQKFASDSPGEQWRNGVADLAVAA